MENAFQLLHRKEKDMLLDIVKEKTISRTELQKKSDLKVANFYNTVDDLLKYKLIKKDEVIVTGKKGRPSEILSLNKRYCYTLYILITGEGYYLGVCDLEGNINEGERNKITDNLHLPLFLSNVETYFKEKSCSYNIQYVTLVTGLNTKRKGIVFSSFFGVDIEDELYKITSLPVYSDSIARAAALGIYNERYSQEHVSLAFFNLEAGIGVGLVHAMIPEEFWYKNRIAIGHWEMDPNGRKCRCGKNGCLITTLGCNDIIRNALEYKEEGTHSSLNEGADVLDLINAANSGDPCATKALDEAAVSFVKAMRIIYSIVNFDIASIGGQLCHGNTYFYTKVKEEMKGLPFTLDIEENYIQKTSKGICYRLLLELLS